MPRWERFSSITPPLTPIGYILIRNTTELNSFYNFSVFSSVIEGKPTVVVHELEITEQDEFTRYLKISEPGAGNYISEQIHLNAIEVSLNVEIIPECKVAVRGTSCINGDVKFIFYTSFV